ncbi:MAG: dTMP kinase [Clostridia bacterium]|nr:dTMP kinase [Clostridia bacterium]
MKYNHRGKFITLEGCEGVGKSTQLTLLKNYLDAKGVPCLFTREPGGTAVGEKIRAILKDESVTMTDETELLLFESARLENTLGVIIPALEEGKIVVADRYIDSTTAYQAYGRGLDVAFVKKLNAIGSAGVKIDLTVFLDAPPFGNTNRQADDRMEKIGADFHARVYEGYKAIEREEERFVAVKTRESKAETAEEIIKLLQERGII